MPGQLPENAVFLLINFKDKENVPKKSRNKMIDSICFQSHFNNIRIYRLGTAQLPEVFDFSIDDSVELARTIIVSHN